MVPPKPAPSSKEIRITPVPEAKPEASPNTLAPAIRPFGPSVSSCRLSRRRKGIEPSTNSASTTPSVRASITAKIQVPSRSASYNFV